MKTLFADPFGSSLYDSTGLIGHRPVHETTNPFAIWIRLAVPKDRILPEHQRLVRTIESLTGWSDRRLASIVGVSHPTISKLRQGASSRVGSRSGLLPRLIDVHEVVARVSLLSHGDPVATDRALSTPIHGERRGLDYLSEGDRANAFLAAVDVIHPRREGPIVGDFPARAGSSTAALFDEDE